MLLYLKTHLGNLKAVRGCTNVMYILQSLDEASSRGLDLLKTPQHFSTVTANL